MEWISAKKENPTKQGYYHVKRNGNYPAVHFWYDGSTGEPIGWSSDTEMWLKE